MARDVEADAIINDKSSPGIRSFINNLKNADKSAKDAQKDFDKTTAATKKLGNASSEHAKNISKLSNEIKAAEKELGSLATAFARTGDAAERMDLTKSIRKQQTEIRNLTKNKGILEDLIPKPSPGFLKKNLITPVSEAFSTISANAIPIIAGVAVAASPFIGATISAAVIGGAGTAGVVGGFLLAAKDPRVQTALTGFKTHIGSELTDAAVPFIDVTLHGIDRIEHAVDTIDFKQLLGDSAKNAEPIIEGVAVAIEKVGNGIEDLIANAGPVMDVLGKGIAGIGDSLGKGLESLADNGPQAAEALGQVFFILDTGIDTIFNTVNMLTELYGALDKLHAFDNFKLFMNVDAGVQQLKTHVSDTMKTTVESVIAATGTIDQYGQAVTTTGQSLGELAQQTLEASDANRSLFDSETSAAAAFDALKQSIKENGKTLDIHTAKGRANREALSGLASTLNATYQAEVDLNGAGAKANGIATSNYNSFIKAATGLGISKKAAADYAAQLGLIPPSKSTKVNANTHDAEARIAALQDQLNGLHNRTVTVTVRTNGDQHVSGGSTGSGGTQVKGSSNAFSSAAAFAREAAAGSNRAQAATPAVDLNSTTNVTLTLDGRVIDRRIVKANAKAAWDQKTGKR